MRQLAQMFGAALGHRIGKRRHRRAVEAEGDAFDFDICRAAGVFEAEVDAAFFLSVGNLTLQRGKAVQLGDHAGLQGFLHQAVGAPGVDAKQPALRGFANFPSAGQFAFRVIGATEPDLPALDLAIEHRTGVGAVNGQQFAANGLDIGEKTLVTTNQPRFFQSRIKAHQPCQLFKPRAMRSTASCKRARFCV